MTSADKTQAPLSIKGANAPINPIPSEPTIAINLDWLRYSYFPAATLTIGDALRIALPRHPAFYLTGEVIPNAKGYDTAQRLSIGVIHYHTKHAAEGISVELSGSALGEMRKAGCTEVFTLEHIQAIAGKVSTMDSAIDCYNLDANFRDILDLDAAGSLETSARMVNEFSGRERIAGENVVHGGVYIGSPKSPRQIKVYDKAREQGKIGVDWTRIEMRWRGRHARAAHDAMLKYGIAETTRKAILSMVNPDIEWFQHAMRGGLAIIEPVRRLETDTKKWLIDIVLPVLERQLMKERAEGGTEIYDAFDKILKSEYNARGRKAVRRK